MDKMTDVLVTNRKELTEAFDAWAATVWEGFKQPIHIEREHADRAAEAVIAQVKINRESAADLRQAAEYLEVDGDVD